MSNKNLLLGIPPADVQAHIRTLPGTTHHSKLTKLDDYETFVFHNFFVDGKALKKRGPDKNSLFFGTRYR